MEISGFYANFARNKMIAMCETQILSKSIGRIGRRSFDRRMKMASPFFVSRKNDMTRLLNEVDGLCDQLHEAFPTISEKDYLVLAPELKIMVDTLKSLRKEAVARHESKDHDDRLRQQINDLEELEHDMLAFCVNAPKNKELHATLSALGKLDLSKYNQPK